MIGRERELRRVAAFLDRPGGAAAFLLRGEAGIGKSTLWRAALDAADARGHRILSARPTEAEARLAHAGLHDLLGGLADAVRPDLPSPQAAALDVALMRADPTGPPLQPLALGLAVLELLRIAATRGPIVLAVDDAPWLDESSAAALRFALRRLDREGVRVVATQRTERDDDPDPSLLADLPGDRVSRLTLEPLGPRDVERLLEASLGLRLTPSRAQLTHRRSGGNPFLALEIGRAIDRVGSSAQDGELDIGSALAAVPRDRLAALSPDARSVVGHVAALAHPTEAVLARAVGTGPARGGLAEARDAGVLVADDDPLRFAHPLLATAAWDATSDEDRRGIHRRLASVVADPHEAARHRALAAEGPDAAVAAALDTAATDAHGRGAPDAAAELAILAAGASEPGTPERARRLAVAGRFRLMAGDVARARALLEDALAAPDAEGGPGRAAILLALAGVRMLGDDFAAATALGEEALRHAGGDRELGVEIRLLLAGTTFITGRGWEAGARHAADALALAESSGDPRLVAEAIGHAAAWRYAMGGGLDPDLERRALELEPHSRHLRTLDLPTYDLASILTIEGETARARELVRGLVDRAERDGDASSLPFLLANAAIGDLLAGDSVSARDRLERAERLAEVTGQSTARAHTLVARARVEARLGDADRALTAAVDALRLIEATGWRMAEWWMRADLAVLELSRGDPAAAVAWVHVPRDPGDESGRRFWASPAAAEALVAAGRPEEAAVVLDELDARLRLHGTPRLRAESLRSRARLLAATGRPEAAAEAVVEAESLHRRMEDRWELARTLLAAAEVHRRLRHRAKARAALREALGLFGGIGAWRWARQTQEQLARIGTGREGGPLTPTQRRVVDLARSGLTNRQVADRLFMSPHTVEAHLSAAYRALGIRGRAELAGALDRVEDRPPH